jgi:hypothetical protein
VLCLLPSRRVTAGNRTHINVSGPKETRKRKNLQLALHAHACSLRCTLSAIRSGTRYAKWAGGSRSQTHRRAATEVVSLYAQLIGELMFIAINTQTLIAQPVNALARFMTTANSELYVLAKGVLRYLKGVKSRKIVWCASRVKFPFVPCEIYAYSDASWADIVPQRKSSLSYLIFCNNVVFSWKSSLSSVLAMSCRS